MNRGAIILLMGLVAAVTAYCALYYGRTHEERKLLEAPAPELAWLKKEFQLSDAEFERVAKLHDGYLPRCEELCRQIAGRNRELKQLVASTNVDARAVEEKLKEVGELRVQCQKNMFNHFLEVSRQMPPEQGKRYLQWVQQQTLAPEHGMEQRHGSGPALETGSTAQGHHHH